MMLPTHVVAVGFNLLFCFLAVLGWFYLQVWRVLFGKECDNANCDAIMINKCECKRLFLYTRNNQLRLQKQAPCPGVSPGSASGYPKHRSSHSSGAHGASPVAHFMASSPVPRSGWAKTNWKTTRSWSQWLKTSCSKESSKNNSLPSSHACVTFATRKVAHSFCGLAGTESLGVGYDPNDNTVSFRNILKSRWKCGLCSTNLTNMEYQQMKIMSECLLLLES